MMNLASTEMLSTRQRSDRTTLIMSMLSLSGAVGCLVLFILFAMVHDYTAMPPVIQLTFAVMGTAYAVLMVLPLLLEWLVKN